MVAIGGADFDPKTERSKPKTFGSSAAAEGNHLALEFVVFAGEKRSLQQLDLLVGEQTHGRPPDRQPIFL